MGKVPVRWTMPWALTRPRAPQRLQMRSAGSILGIGSVGINSRQEWPLRDGGHWLWGISGGRPSVSQSAQQPLPRGGIVDLKFLEAPVCSSEFLDLFWAMRLSERKYLELCIETAKHFLHHGCHRTDP